MNEKLQHQDNMYYEWREKSFNAWLANTNPSNMRETLQNWHFLQGEKMSTIYAKFILIDCISIVGACFNPDDEPSEYINKEDGKPILQKTEAKLMDKYIDRCAAALGAENICIYEFCKDIIQQKYGV